MGSAPSNESNREIPLPPTSSAPISQGKPPNKVPDTVSSTSEIPSSDNNVSTAEIPSSHGENALTAGETEESKDRRKTEDELNEFKTKTYLMLKKSASDAMAITQKLNDDGIYVENIRVTIELFQKAYFMLEKASLEHITGFRIEISNILIQSEFINIVCDCLLKMHVRGWMSADGNLDRIGYNILRNTLSMAQNYSDASDDIVYSFVNYKNYLETLKTMLEESAARHLKNDTSQFTIADSAILGSVLGVVHNISMRPNSVTRLRSLNFADVIKLYLNSWKESFSLSALATLAAIVNEAECDIINAAPKRVQHLLDVLKKGLDTNLRRYSGWSCKECAYTVRLLAQNDANKKLLVQLGALTLLVKMGRTGNEDEQYESVQAVWALCFDKSNQQKVAKEGSLGVVELLFDLKTSSNARIRQACNGALWTLRDALASSELEKYRIFAIKLDADISKKAEGKKGTDTEAKTTDDRGHIMISYQWDNQQMLKVIRDTLQENKFKVWMDIDEMSGSTLQAMASAVENAQLVLMCMSQKYKNSPNCRAEAEYAFKKNKEILPLKMERGYDPDGWLGIICGTKMFYDFSGKYKFEDKLNELLRELAKNWNKKGPQSELSIQPKFEQRIHPQAVVAFDHVDSASTPSSSSRILVSMETIDSVRKWPDSALKTWIDKNGLKSVLPSDINTYDIAMLLQMRMESPDFFYRCTQDILKIRNLSSLTKLLWALQTIARDGPI